MPRMFLKIPMMRTLPLLPPSKSPAWSLKWSLRPGKAHHQIGERKGPDLERGRVTPGQGADPGAHLQGRGGERGTETGPQLKEETEVEREGLAPQVKAEET